MALIFVLGLGLRLGAISDVPDAVGDLTGDERVYWRVGANLRAHGVFAYETAVPSAFRAPLLPTLVRLSQGDFSRPHRSRRFMLLVWAIGFVALVAVSMKLAGMPGAYIAAACYSLHPTLIAVSENLRTETLDVTFLAVIALLAVRWLKDTSARNALWLGLAVGASLCARSTLFLLPLCFVAVAFIVPQWLPRKRSWAPILLLGVALPLVPWVIRNALHFREFIPLERRPAALGLYYASLGHVPPLGLSKYTVLAERQDPRLAKVDTITQRRILGRLAVFNIVSQPGRYLWSVMMRFFILWGSQWPLVLLGGIALWIARKRREAWLLAGLASYYSINAFLDLYLIRMAPAIVPLILLIALAWRECRPQVGEMDLPIQKGLLRFTRAIPIVLWLICQPFLLGDIATRMPSSLMYATRQLPEPKVFLDNVVLDARTGRSEAALRRLDVWGPAYGDYAALNITYGALLRGAGREAEALGRFRRAADLLEDVPPERPMRQAALTALQ
jgi:hypothetical protein